MTTVDRREELWGEHPRGMVPVVGALAAFLALIPIFVTRFLPFNDYPFHLARMVILSQLNNPIFARFYMAGSFFLPNMAMDAVVVPLSSLVGPELASRAFVGLTILTILFGTFALHWAAHRRLSAWPLLAILVLHNGILRFGFLNYLFGMGLALWAAALWMLLRPGWVRFAATFISSILLIYCHMEAFCIFAVIAGSVALERAFEEWRRDSSWTVVRDLVYAASPFLLTIALFFVFSPTASVAGKGFAYAPGLGTKPVGALFSLSSGVTWLDMTSLFCVVAVFVWLAATRKIAFSRPLAFATIMMSLALFVVPDSVMGALYADVRIGPAIALLAIATFDLRANAGRAAIYSVTALILVLSVVRAATLTAVWADYSREIALIVDAVTRIEPGSTLFAATSQPYPSLVADTPERRIPWSPPLKHVASYAVLGAPVFVPMTWAEPTQQPLNVRPAYRDPYSFQGNNPRKVYDAAALPDFVKTIADKVESGQWQGLGNVYVLVVGAEGAASGATIPAVDVIAKGARFALLRLHVPAHFSQRDPRISRTLIKNEP
jgi:hypothetical protein